MTGKNKLQADRNAEYVIGLAIPEVLKEGKACGDFIDYNGFIPPEFILQTIDLPLAKSASSI